MPLINVHRLRLRISRLLSAKSAKSKSLSLILSALPAPLARTLRLTPRQQLQAPSPKAEDEKNPLERPKGPLHFLPSSTCPICYSLSTAPPTSIPTDPTSAVPDAVVGASLAAAAGADQDTSVKLPYITDCGWECRYCYYCIVGRLASAQEDGEDRWSCLRCGGEVSGASREVEVHEQDSNGLQEGKIAGDQEVLTEDGATSEGDGEEEDEVESVGSEHDRWRA